MRDCDLLFDWTNDVECRKNSFQQEKIEYDIHVQWLQNYLKNPNCNLFIVMDIDKEIGVLRLEYDENIAEISYSVASKERNKGYGKAILQLAEEYVKKEEKCILELMGKVKRENAISQRKFESLNFERKDRDNYIEYRKKVR